MFGPSPWREPAPEFVRSAAAAVLLRAAGLTMSRRLVWAVAVLLTAVGCHPAESGGSTAITRSYDVPVPALPPAGAVRIVPQKLTEDGKAVRWKWVVGDRNWKRLHLSDVASDRSAELAEPYPLDDPVVSGGTNAFECELAITAGDAPDGRADLSHAFSLRPVGVRLTGAVNRGISDGGTSSDGSLRRGLKRVAADQAARALLTEERVLRLPVDQPLLEVAGEGADGSPFHQVFRIKVAD
jgi:hypothetical protein